MDHESNKFEVGSTYQMRFIGDSQLRPEFKCTKRTEKRATFKNFNTGETFTRAIRDWDGEEYINHGSYSMAPSINAKNKVV